VAGSCEYGNEFLCFIKGRELLDKLIYTSSVSQNELHSMDLIS
jgi:hypothetical protein